jgi:acyl-CoA thioesterase I
MLRSIGILLTSLLFACSAAAAATADKVILVFGDSLSAGYGLGKATDGWVSLLQKRLSDQGYGYRVVNASVSGETTSGGKARLPRALAQHRPELVILELGANDGLRALPLAGARTNLSEMITTTQRSGAKLLLVGIQIPPNYGAQYAGGFRDLFDDLARHHRVPLVPWLMKGVALESRYMQDDGLHPNAEGQPLLLENVWPRLQPLLAKNPVPKKN